MVVALIALFISLGGVAWAAIGNNAVKSRHIKDGQIKEQDLAPGAVTTVKLADGSITTAKVVDETLVGDDLIDETVTGSKIADDTLTGAKVEDGSLGGADIDEASLGGLTKASGGSCCTITKDSLPFNTPYSASDPSTFIALGEGFELRTAGDSDTFQFCEVDGRSFDILGAYAYMSGVRSLIAFSPGPPSCQTIDINGGGSSAGIGDFELLVTRASQHVWGEMTETGSVARITILGP